jgi:hypothetical protein
MGFQVDMSPLERSSANIGRSLMGIGQNIGGAIQRSDQQQRQQQEQGDVEAFMRQAMSGDPVAFQELMIKSPQAARMVAEHLQQQKATQQGEQQQFQSQMDNDTADFVELMHLAPPEQQEAMFNAAIDDPRYDIDEEDRPLFMDVNARKALIGQVKGQEYSENFFGGSGDGDLPAETVGFNDLIKDFTPEQKKLAKQVKAGIKGRAISNAELSAIQSGEIDDYGKWKVQQRQAEKFAELTGSSRAKAIDSGIEKIAKIDLGLSNIDAAIQAINDGAGTGAIEKRFPSLRAASIALDNIQGRMALDVIGAVTFGALSQGELDLAKSVALPTGLEAPELIKYLNDKKAAQQKLRDYYNEQIQFLDQGGTVAGFMRQKERGSINKPVQGQGSSNQDQQALQWAKANPNDPRAAKILNKLQSGAQ